jgi:hypothetical protein
MCSGWKIYYVLFIYLVFHDLNIVILVLQVIFFHRKDCVLYTGERWTLFCIVVPLYECGNYGLVPLTHEKIYRLANELQASQERLCSIKFVKYVVEIFHPFKGIISIPLLSTTIMHGDKKSIFFPPLSSQTRPHVDVIVDKEAAKAQKWSKTSTYICACAV